MRNDPSNTFSEWLGELVDKLWDNGPFYTKAFKANIKSAILKRHKEELLAARLDTYKFQHVNCDVCGEVKRVATETHDNNGAVVGVICKECFDEISQLQAGNNTETP